MQQTKAALLLPGRRHPPPKPPRWRSQVTHFRLAFQESEAAGLNLTHKPAPDSGSGESKGTHCFPLETRALTHSDCSPCGVSGRFQVLIGKKDWMLNCQRMARLLRQFPFTIFPFRWQGYVHWSRGVVSTGSLAEVKRFLVVCPFSQPVSHWTCVQSTWTQCQILSWANWALRHMFTRMPALLPSFFSFRFLDFHKLI